jgi:hypothetical protein
MTITDNFALVLADVMSKVSSLANPETVSRAAASAVLPELRDRIHGEGKNENGAQIGTYSLSYLKLRQAKYNRTSDSSVVASLTRQLENSYILGADGKSYGISVATPLSFDKIKWLTDKYGDLWMLTKEEEKIALDAAKETSNKILNESK